MELEGKEGIIYEIYTIIFIIIHSLVTMARSTRKMVRTKNYIMILKRSTNQLSKVLFSYKINDKKKKEKNEILNGELSWYLSRNVLYAVLFWLSLFTFPVGET